MASGAVQVSARPRGRIHVVVARLRVLALIASAVALLGAAPAALAAGPEHWVDSLNDPQFDIDETAWASDWCGFEVDAQVSGHIRGHEFAADGRSVVALIVYGIRVVYTNVETGATVRLRDIGPDRFFVKDGRQYVAVTGRSSNGTGVIGLVIFDLETDEIVHESGNDQGVFNDWFCDAIS
jgi:hypothetical protein